MSTRKLIRSARRMVEDAGCHWAGHAYQGNDHIRIRALSPAGREIGITMAATPRNSDHSLAITRAALRSRLRGEG